MLPQQLNVSGSVGFAHYFTVFRFGHFLLRGCLHIMREQAIKRIVGTTSRFVRSANNSRNRSFPMRQQRTQRMSTPGPMSRAGNGLPTCGYTLIVDGLANDAESKQSETIELAAA